MLRNIAIDVISVGHEKKPPNTLRAPMKTYKVDCVMERVAMDKMGPIPLSNRNNKYVLVIQDYFSKLVEAYLLPDQEAETVAQVFVEQFVSHWGVRMQIHTNQGSNFESKLFRELCTLLGIDKTRTTGLHPQSDGMVERYNATMEAMSATCVTKDQKNLDSLLPLQMMAYPSAEHDTTKYSPNVMMFGRKLRQPVDLLYGTVSNTENFDNLSDYVHNTRTYLDTVYGFARENINNACDRSGIMTTKLTLNHILLGMLYGYMIQNVK